MSSVVGALSPKEVDDIVQLAAVDGELFGQTFFPRAFRQPWGDMHRSIWQMLLAPNRHTSMMVFRGGAKTTLTRVYTAFRIAYGLSHTIMYVSASQSHAIRSVDWIAKQIMYNKFFRQTFGLEKGSKWASEEIEILHGVQKHPIRLIAAGITGQTRGVNVDDYRPDLIVVDDPLDEENTATLEQRQKTEQLFFGSLEKSLAPVTEAPDAKMVLLATPLHREDLVVASTKDPQWCSQVYGCFTESGESRWPARFPTEVLLKDKQAHVERNQLSLWLREMECKLVDKESAFFRAEWLQYWKTLPANMRIYMAVDPASSERKTADFQAVAVIGVYDSDIYLLEYSQARGQDPEEFAVEFFRLVLKWRPLQCAVESVAYQKTLAWYLRKEMKKRGVFVQIVEWRDRRNKQDRILQAFSGRCANKAFYCSAKHSEFISQFCDYPEVSHDDLLDAVSMAISIINPALVDAAPDIYQAEAAKVISLGAWRAAP